MVNKQFSEMAKFTRVSKLSKKERQELMIALCEAMVALKNPEEAAKFLTDLISPQETEMLAKRLAIAKLLVEGKTYESIRNLLKVGFATIARVNTWLNLSGEGFKLVLQRTRKGKKAYEHSIEERFDPYSWYNIKRRYSLYFWPQLLIEELMKQSDNRQKNKITTILQSMENKFTVFSKQTNKEIYQQFKHVKQLAK